MSDVLAPTAAQLRKRLAAAQASARMPSMVAAVVRDGEVVWADTRGRVAGPGTRPNADTQYRIGSITKTMTAALVMQLRERGLLDLSDPVGKYLPDAPLAERSVRSLLAHASGMRAEPHGDWWERSPGLSWERLAAAQADAASVLAPDRRFHYSNLGYAVLGQLAATLRRRPWHDAVRHDLLDPLGLSRTSYEPEQPHASGYSVHAFAGTLTDEPAPDTGAMAPAGQLWSTVGDLAAWLGFLLHPDPRILPVDAVTDMRTPQSGAPETASTATYGLGLELVSAGGGLLCGHGGSMPGFLAGMYGDPATRVGAVVLANGTSGLDIVTLLRSLVETVLEHEPVCEPEWIPTESVDATTGELLGLWHWGNAAYTVSVENGELSLAGLRGGRRARFRPAGEDTFLGTDGYFAGERLRVVRRPDGEISHLDLVTYVLTRSPYDPWAPIPGGPPAVSGPG